MESFTGEGRGGIQEALMIRLSELIPTFNDRFDADLSHKDGLTIYMELPSRPSETRMCSSARRTTPRSNLG